MNLLRVFNAREGFTRKDDKLPKKFFKPLAGTGPTAGFAVICDQLKAALDLYYALLGWTANGVPTKAKLIELGIPWAVEHLPVSE